MNSLVRILLMTGSLLCFCSCLLGQTNRGSDERKDFKVSPASFLYRLKSVDYNSYSTFSTAPENWLTPQNVLELFSHIHDPRCCGSVLNSFSSYVPATRSSVGHEARRLIMGYCKQAYPPVFRGNVPSNVAELKKQFRERLELEDGGVALWTEMEPKINEEISKAEIRRDRELLVVFSGSGCRSGHYEDEMFASYSKRQGIVLNGKEISYQQLGEKLERRSIACLILQVESPAKVSLEDVREVLGNIAIQIDSSKKQVAFDLDIDGDKIIGSLNK